jgi:hypothetical protein
MKLADAFNVVRSRWSEVDGAGDKYGPDGLIDNNELLTVRNDPRRSDELREAADAFVQLGPSHYPYVTLNPNSVNRRNGSVWWGLSPSGLDDLIRRYDPRWEMSIQQRQIATPAPQFGIETNILMGQLMQILNSSEFALPHEDEVYRAAGLPVPERKPMDWGTPLIPKASWAVFTDQRNLNAFSQAIFADGFDLPASVHAAFDDATRVFTFGPNANAQAVLTTWVPQLLSLWERTPHTVENRPELDLLIYLSVVARTILNPAVSGSVGKAERVEHYM